MMPDEPPAAPDAKRMTGRILVWDPPRVSGGFAPGEHAFLDRLEALLAGREMPSWNDRYAELASAYPPR